MRNKQSKNDNSPLGNSSTDANQSKLAIQKSLARSLIIGTGILTIATLLPVLEQAGFDVDAGVTAATKPLVEGVTAHWGKGVMLSGVAAALVGEGDLRQRAIRAGLGCGAAGAVVLGLIALLS